MPVRLFCNRAICNYSYNVGQNICKLFHALAQNLFRKSPYSVKIRENTDQKKLSIWTLFTQCRARKSRKISRKIFH